jgi:hypothetical protein
MSKNPAPYFPWLIAILTSLALMTSNGMSISGLSVFDESLLGEFGWTRGELKFRDMVTLGVAGLLAPLMGVLIDRYGVRACMLAGALALASMQTGIVWGAVLAFGLGIWLTGVLYTSQQSYSLAFAIFCGLILVALLAITQVRYPDRPSVQ